MLVGTEGLMLHAIVHAADIRDRDGGENAAMRPGRRPDHPGACASQAAG